MGGTSGSNSSGSPDEDGDKSGVARYDGFLDRAIQQASKLAGAAVEQLRTQYPDADDGVLVAKLEVLFSTTVTTTGAATGGMAAAPVVGTFAALATGIGDGTFFDGERFACSGSCECVWDSCRALRASAGSFVNGASGWRSCRWNDQGGR